MPLFHEALQFFFFFFQHCYMMDPNEILLQTISENRHPLAHIKSLLVRPEVSVNFADPINHQTALHIAARRGDVDVVKLLLSYGAHVNGGTVDLMTPLHEACFGGHPEAVAILISEGAEVQVPVLKHSYLPYPTYIWYSNPFVNCAVHPPPPQKIKRNSNGGGGANQKTFLRGGGNGYFLESHVRYFWVCATM